MNQLMLFCERTGFTQKEALYMIGRGQKQDEGNLNQAEKNALKRIEEIYNKILVLRHDQKDSVLRWFRTHNELLGGYTPLASCRTHDPEEGRDSVEALISRIEDGAF